MPTSQLIIFFLYCCVSNNVLGLISEYECRNSFNHCDLLVKNTDRACLIPSYSWSCPETCGVCQASCKDYFAQCNHYASNCLQKHIQEQCPKSCASCDVCEDLISSKLCHEYKGRCKKDISVQYACRETCGLCEDECNDASVSENLCHIFESRGYCHIPQFMDFMKKACRKTCGFCQFEHC